MSPTVSVVIPVCNGAAVVRRAVNSVLAQTAEGVTLEVIVCDDGSTDGTASVLAEYGGRIQVISQENQGRGAARNACLAAATGEFVALLDADDWWMPHKLTSQLEAAADHPDAGVFGGDAYVVNAGGQIYRLLNGEYHVGHSGWVFPYLLRHDFMPTSTVMVRRSALEIAGPFDPALRRAQDMDWLLRLSAVVPFHYTTDVLAYYDDRNWHEPTTRVDTCAGVIALLEKAERTFSALAAEHRHAFDKSYSHAAAVIADDHARRGRHDDAASWWDRALAHMPHSRDLRKRAALARYGAAAPDAAAAFQRLLDLDPHDQDARFYLGTLRLIAGQPSAARDLLATALYDGDYQRFPECVNNLGVAHARLGDLDRAKQLIDQAVRQRSFYDDAIVNAGLLANRDTAGLRVSRFRQADAC